MGNSIVAQGVELMLFGMGTVVVFLGLLVVVTVAMSGLVNRYFPEAPVAAAAAPRRDGHDARADGEVVAAIGAAISQHRKRKGS